jgi:glycine/D-amino acid oxidase-like deaminating enzyme
MDAPAGFEHAAGWYAETVARPQRWPALTFDMDVDVCVVGGGLAGLTTALEIAKRGWTVALLEGRRIAWNASGRSTGFVRPGFAESVDEILERCGFDHTRALWALSDEGAAYVRNLIRTTGMPGTDPVEGWLDVSKIDDGDEALALVTLLGQEFGVEVEGWPTDKVRSVLKSDHYFHALHFPRAFSIHPLNYALGLAEAADRAGVRIFEETPALSIDPAGVRKRVMTAGARVRANHIVLAGNVHLGTVAPRLAQTMIPVSTYVAVTAPLGDRLADAIAFPGAVSDTRFADYHYRIVDGNRLLWAGGVSARGNRPAAHGARLKQAIGRIYPQLRPVEIAHVWSGTTGFTVHRMPQIGEVAPGLWLASGFGGHGINTTAMAGNIIARAIVDRDDTWRLFLPYDLVWAGGFVGRTVMHVSAWVQRSHENLLARSARKREEIGRRDDAAMRLAVPAGADSGGKSAPGTLGSGFTRANRWTRTIAAARRARQFGRGGGAATRTPASSTAGSVGQPPEMPAESTKSVAPGQSATNSPQVSD